MCGSRSSGITRLDNKLSQHIEILFSDLNQLPLKQFEEIAKFAQQKQQDLPLEIISPRQILLNH